MIKCDDGEFTQQQSRLGLAALLLASDHFLHGRDSQAIALWQQLLDEEPPASTEPRC